MKKTAIIIIVLTLSILSAAMIKIDSAGFTEEDRSAKIKFSHQFHVKDQGIACSDCHTAAPKSISSSDKLFGDHNSCQTCHQEQIDSSCEFCHTQKDDPVGFENPKRELIFTHEKHLLMEDVQCETCHKGLEDVDYASGKNMPNMESCNTCHNNTKATNQCETCHTDFSSLIPNNHNEADFKKDHKTLVRVGAMDLSCSTCHEETFCQQCHDGASLINFGKDGYMSEPTIRFTRRDSPKMLNLQIAHDLNYRFTHSIDAKSKKTDCNSCHEKESFCSTCHQAGGNITQSYFKPKWHDASNFTTFGVGSGGGLHSDMARRDIESCASCHDVEGADPACIRCHVDNDGVKNTNPKTHKTSYMKGEEGIWHETNGAVCYTCHVDPNARTDGRRGIGFCGYCHL
jgi:c(7)-type cytochrome triheme protein